jgi:hypothetical protein
MMQHVTLPFTLSKDSKTKAVSEVTFTVQSPRSSFQAVSIAGVKFSKVFEQERYNIGNYPFTQFWDDRKEYLQLQRENIALGNLVRNDLQFGINRTPELRALDELPHWIEIDIDQSRPLDRSSIGVNAQLEYQSDDREKEVFSEDPGKVQSLLLLNTNLIRGEYGGWEGTVTCNMSNIGTFRLRNEGQGTIFTIKACLYDFKNKGMSTFPAMQLDLLFR